MSSLRDFFDLNETIILFAYGLAFFVLGLAVALQSRRSSRLELARSLSWLAAFGILHGLYEWGDVFIPIQASYLSPPAIHLLHQAHLLLLAVSFACLFQFGVALIRPVGRLHWLRAVPAAAMAVWFFVTFFPLASLRSDVDAWFNLGNALARYFIGFPGALLAAYGLRQHAKLRIAPLNVPHIVDTLRVAGIALALYAVFGGLIPPPIPYFPGNLLNSETVAQALGVPPPVFRSLVGMMMAIAVIRALEVFEVETARIIESMEQQQILAAERQRIARELHDGAIQTVYTAGLLVESAQHLAPPDSEVAQRLDKALTVLQDAIHDLRRNLAELHTVPSVEPLSAAIRRVAEDSRFRSLVDVSLDLRLPNEDRLSPLRTDHVLAILQESLSNAMRHGRARHVAIEASRVDDRLSLTVRDDGVGIPDQPKAGYGLRNIRDRARLLGGRLEVRANDGRGTIVQLDIPWREER